VGISRKLINNSYNFLDLVGCLIKTNAYRTPISSLKKLIQTMCGIVAYIGTKQAYPILIKGLQRLEYRGYDSAGVALLNGDLSIYKKKGKVSDLELFTEGKDLEATIGIGHTRWATHGPPNDVNSHPHTSSNSRLALVHNGIIENYAPLKMALQRLGHKFTSDTDTEVLVHLIEELQERESLPLEEAIVVIDKTDKTKIVAARKQSPLVLGVGKGELFFASDATPIVEHTKRVVYINDNEIVTARMDGTFDIKTIANVTQVPFIQELELTIEALEKGGYDSFMLKEIHE
jgi:glutamine---fructose-6-phosphate transaminase (isomerizing)